MSVRSRRTVPDEVRIAIENGVKLDQLLSSVGEVKAEQKRFNDGVVIPLREHDTINKTDKMDRKLGFIQWLLTGLLAVPPLLIVSHQVFHVP